MSQEEFERQEPFDLSNGVRIYYNGTSIDFDRFDNHRVTDDGDSIIIQTFYDDGRRRTRYRFYKQHIAALVDYYD